MYETLRAKTTSSVDEASANKTSINEPRLTNNAPIETPSHSYTNGHVDEIDELTDTQLFPEVPQLDDDYDEVDSGVDEDHTHIDLPSIGFVILEKLGAPPPTQTIQAIGPNHPIVFVTYSGQADHGDAARAAGAIVVKMRGLRLKHFINSERRIILCLCLISAYHGSTGYLY